MIFHENAESFYVPISNIGRFEFPCRLVNIYFLFVCFLIIIASLGVVIRHLIPSYLRDGDVVLVHISVVTNQVLCPLLN